MPLKKIVQIILTGLFCCFLLLGGNGTRKDEIELSIGELKVNYVENPIGLDDKQPMFSWNIISNEYHVYQSAYQIKVYKEELLTHKETLVWDSGKVISSQTTNILYNGQPLSEHSTYLWEVTVWDENDCKHEVMQAGKFETAVLNGVPFKNCSFIGVQDKDIDREGLPAFVKSFTLKEKEVEKAYYYGGALGIYDLYIDGERVGAAAYDELKPGWSNFNKTLLYNTYDVTNILKRQKENTIAVMLSKGWCLGEIAHDTYQYDRPWYIAKILVLYEDGTEQEIVTDHSWRYFKDTVVVSADIYEGEVYDARRYHLQELSKYSDSKNEFEKLGFENVALYENKELKYFSWYGDKVTTQELYSRHAEQNLPLKIKKNETVILDMGQNMAALPYMKVKAEQGTKIVLKFAEMLNDTGEKERGNDGAAGTLYRENLRTAKARVLYIADGNNGEYQSTFTYFGYRYVSITPDKDMILLDFESKFLGISQKSAGEITTDHEKVNRLFENIQWSQRDNWLLVATDCPQRDERLPWTGDLQVFCKTSLYNDELYQFYIKWCRDAIDSQINGTYPNIIPYNKVTGTGNAGWADAGIIIPYFLYHHYQDKRFVTMMYPSMKLYMEWLENSHLNGAAPTYGDWLGYEDTDKVLIAICYYAQDALYMSKMAQAVGERKDAEYYLDLYDQIKKHFNQQYVKEGHLTEKSQTACVLALHMGLVDGETKRNTKMALLENIKNNGYKLSTGFIGTSLLLETLSEAGMDHAAYRLLLCEENPSWLYSVNQGATTIWERWDSYTKESGFHKDGMNSFNHFSYGSVGKWMYEYMLGIHYYPMQETAYQFVLAPRVFDGLSVKEGINKCSGHYNSPFGRIGLCWEKSQGGVRYHVEIPANTKAKIVLQTDTLFGEGEVLFQGEYMPLEKLENDGYIFELDRNKEEISFILTSGNYEFR